MSLPEKRLAGRQTQEQATSRDKRTRNLIWSMLVLFVMIFILLMAVLGYVGVLAYDTSHEEDVTHNAICGLLAQAGTAPTITSVQRERLVEDDRAFRCDIPPSTVRKP